jgi:hypothetical protein
MKYLCLIRLCLLMIVPVLLWACTGGKPEIIEKKCASCHPSAFVYQHKRPIQEWDRLLYGMKARGLKITPMEEKAIRDILSKDYSSE